MLMLLTAISWSKAKIYEFVSGAPAGRDFFPSPTCRKNQWFSFFNLSRLKSSCYSPSVQLSGVSFHQYPTFMLTQGLQMSDLNTSWERETLFNDHSAWKIIFWLKNHLYGHPGKLFFVTRCARDKPIIIFGLIRIFMFRPDFSLKFSFGLSLSLRESFENTVKKSIIFHRVFTKF